MSLPRPSPARYSTPPSSPPITPSSTPPSTPLSSSSPPSTPPPSRTPPSTSPTALPLPNPPELFSTPISNRGVTLHAATSNHYVYKEAHVRAAAELKDRYEKVSIEAFLKLLPKGPKGMPEPDYAAVSRVAKIVPETAQYVPFIKAMKNYLANDWYLIDTSKSADVSPAVQFFSGSGIKPDMGLYAGKRGPKQKVTDASAVDVFGEFKIDDVDDPFYVHKVHSSDTATARDTRGQIVLYINAIQATQPRTRVFFFFILRDQCRLFCHSRAGSLYTDPFNYTKHSYLHEFFWRLTHASLSERGHDTSLKPVKGVQSDLGAARKALQLKEQDVLYEVDVGDRTFYISQPFTVHHHYPVGRGTRCYAAYDPKESDPNRKFILKDCWRNSKYPVEHVTYQQLKQAGVSHIPNAVVGADVGVEGSFQETELCGIHLVHYRLVLDIFGLPLSKAPSTYAFMRAIFHALTAHHDACSKAKLLHRDISSGNIIIHEGDGYLIDWERAKGLDDREVRANERTGTWQFLSIRLLQNPRLPHLIRDDLESFIYVVIHGAISFAQNNMTPSERLFFLRLFEHSEKEASSARLLLINGLAQLKLTTSHFRMLLHELVSLVRPLYLDEPESSNFVKDLFVSTMPVPPVVIQFPPGAVQTIFTRLHDQLYTHTRIIEIFSKAEANEVWRNTMVPDWKQNEVSPPHPSTDPLQLKFARDLNYRSLISSYRTTDNPSPPQTPILSSKLPTTPAALQMTLPLAIPVPAT
ncbi:hypothetical protein D9757_003152 [Collybiopsis confluens]|uniref:Fungal-type protein kinase domain-containing protein n=1 Tax=Collybiopsis confluens TaxID=2823264 RepID=A0A8H5HX72_9AGAR|nr:hypothetical protein D9757_009497 [Collybiopsis confluens]KAF5391093.1 hypothetical protein D9757_003152 [Collybiopsis confluens]